MGISPLASVIFTNQMSVSATSLQNSHNNRVDLQNMMANSMVQERDEKVLEVRPAEENQGVDADKEHQKEQADEQLKRSKKEQKDKDEDEKEPLHTLDIFV